VQTRRALHGSKRLRRTYSNATPIRFSVRHAKRQGTWCPSGDMIRVKRIGIPTELVTWSIAPALDLSRTMQLIQPLSNRIVPALNTLLRTTARFSITIPSMKH
jgi:hypothetical protein